MIHYMKLNDKPFNLIKRRFKTYELRLFDEKRSKIEVGDYIEFTNRTDNNKQLLVEVVGIHRFKTFKDLYKDIPLERSGYLSTELDGASHLDMLEFYDEEKQSFYGVVAIEIKLIK